MEDAAVQRSPIWYYDGSIVLQAEQAQFCVHRSVLTQHSVVFRELLEETQPEEHTEVVEGHPLVLLSDTALELGHLLQALYDPSALRVVQLGEDTFLMLCAILHLSTKYMISHLRSAVAACFCTTFPSSLTDWRLVSSSYPTVVSAWEFDVANTLQEAQLFLPLPSLCFRIALYTSELDIFRSSLSPRNKERIFGGMPSLRSNFRYALYEGFEYLVDGAPDNRCVTRQRCRDSAAGRSKLQILRECIGGPSCRDPFDFNLPSLRSSYGPLPLCDECVDSLNMRIREDVITDWEDLPGKFELGDWLDLARRDAEYLVNISNRDSDA